MVLLAFENGRAFFEEGARALAHVCCGEELAEEFGFELQAFCERQ